MTQHSFIAALTDTQLIQISGEQRHEYLHGQITVATKAFDPNTARIAAHCDFKGKMFSTSLISEYQDAFLMSMHVESVNESISQLKKYGVFSKVDISISSELKSFGIVGKQHLKDLKVLFPEIALDAVQAKHFAVISNQFGQAICFIDTVNMTENGLAYLCHLTQKGVQRLHDITDNQPFVAPDYWNQLEIAAGIGNIQTATLGQFVPQMLNLQSINAIDFDKGCYMGQEVVARTKFLGKNKRASYILKTNQMTKANAGDIVEIQMGDNWRRGGTIVRAAYTDESGFNALAVLANDTNVGSVVRLKDTDIEMTVTAVPYTMLE